jgi:hypothetical protein
MSGLFRRLSSRRSEGPESTKPPTAAEPGATDAPASTPAEPEGRKSLLTDPAAPTRVMREGEQPGGLVSGDPLHGAPPPDAPAADPDARTPADPILDAPAPADPGTHVGPAPLVDPGPAVDPNAPAPLAQPGVPAHQPPAGDPVADLPAGLDPDELAASPSTSARRGKLRRRAAFLRAARELLLRDLGGFVYELHRTAHDVEHEAHRRLRETKLARLSRVDAELHELELRLDDVRRQVLVREPGVGGECPHCGELFSSAAHYCSHCGLPLTEAARKELAKAQQPEPVASVDQPTQEISPLDPDHPDAGADFQWPRRAASPDAAASAADAAPAAAAETLGAASEATASDEAATPAAGADAAAPPEGGGDATPAADEPTPDGGGDATPAADEPAPVGDGDAATPREGGGDATPAADEPAPVGDGDAATTAHGGDDAPPADEPTPVGDGDAATAPAGDPTSDEANPVGDAAPAPAGDPTPDGPTPVGDGDAAAPEAGQDAATREYETWRGQASDGRAADDATRNGRELRPVERRR